MIWRLVFDAIWRSRFIYVYMLPVVGLFWAMAAGGIAHAGPGLTASITIAYFFGPVGAVTMMSLRELRTLPVSDRDLWVATWMTSTVANGVYLAAAQAAGIVGVMIFTGATAVSTEAILFTWIYCVAYAGALMPVMPLLGYSLGNIQTRRPRWLWIVTSTGLVLLLLGAAALPYSFAHLLPLAFAQLWWGPVVAVIGCLGLAGLSFAWTPKRGGFVRATIARQEPIPTPAQRHRQFVDRLTGIPRIAWPYIAWMLGLSVAGLAGFICYWAAFESRTPFTTFLRNNALLLFDTGFLPRPDMGRMWVVLTIVWITTSPPWKPFTRQLKILPVATSRINALLLATPFIQWASVWLCLIVLHVAVLGHFPRSLRPEIFVLVGGLCALGQSVMSSQGARGNIWIIVAVGALTPLLQRLMNKVPAAMAEGILFGAGLLALAAAAFMNHRTLTRSGSSANVYRDQLPFGIPTPGARH